jgi:predicted enzyme related to lactoylglutathione lyase
MRAKSIVSLLASAAFSAAAASAAFAAEAQPAASDDMFKSKNFYADQANWSNPRYFRCNTPAQLDQMTAPKGGAGVRASGAAGNCAVDTPRARIASPYAYKTAQEHYDALMAQAKARGGPTVHPKGQTPDWDGYYTRDAAASPGSDWLSGIGVQVPTVLSVLTPEYQARMVQALYHEAVDHVPVNPDELCYPEGLMRWWMRGAAGQEFQVTTAPWKVQFLSAGRDNFLRQVLIGQKHVDKVPQWYGEAIGFWDGETLVSYTANVQAWTLSHGMFEFSGKLQVIEIFKPVKAGGKLVAIDHESVFYDDDAFSTPIRAVDRFTRRATPGTAKRFEQFICLTNFRTLGGKLVEVDPKHEYYIDYLNRPWAQNWERFFEQGWKRPKDSYEPGYKPLQ